MQITHEDALSVNEAELSMERRLGASEEDSRRAEQSCEHVSEAWADRRCPACADETYTPEWLKLNGEEDQHTLIAAGNYAKSLSLRAL